MEALSSTGSIKDDGRPCLNSLAPRSRLGVAPFCCHSTTGSFFRPPGRWGRDAGPF
jgi:hypothetical protein|eukprot:COSAG01_NODE_122_length_25212_cov_25.945646_21_plen_56_part_00